MTIKGDRILVKTTAFRKHHEQVHDIVECFKKELDVGRITDNPEPLTRIIRELFGKFSMHLAYEDATLYPRLIGNDDNAVKYTATRFQSEMGGLKGIFDAYKEKWPGPQAISSDPKGFVDETWLILDCLETRIEREETELYALVDRLG